MCWAISRVDYRAGIELTTAPKRGHPSNSWWGVFALQPPEFLAPDGHAQVSEDARPDTSARK